MEEMTLEKLAVMIQKGFEETATKADLAALRKEVNDRFKRVDERFDKIEDDIRYIYGSLDVIRREIAEIKEQLKRVVYREELEAVKARVAALEKKLGIT